MWRPMPACELIGSAANVVFDDVIAQNHTDLLAVGEVLTQAQRIGDSAFAFLVSVVDVLEAEFLAIGQQAQEIAEFLPPVTIMMSRMPASTSV